MMNYEALEIEIIEFDTEEVITTSGDPKEPIVGPEL